jgi:hypothetical protein
MYIDNIHRFKESSLEDEVHLHNSGTVKRYLPPSEHNLDQELKGLVHKWPVRTARQVVSSKHPSVVE